MADVLILDDMPSIRRGRQAKPLPLADEIREALEGNPEKWISNGETYANAEDARAVAQKYQRHFSDDLPVTTSVRAVDTDGNIVTEPRKDTEYEYRFYLQQIKPGSETEKA